MFFDTRLPATAEINASIVLDREIVTSMSAENRSSASFTGSTRFYAFDALWINGEDLRQLPLIERKPDSALRCASRVSDSATATRAIPILMGGRVVVLLLLMQFTRMQSDNVRGC
jgi:hypothetical protein